MMIQLEGQISVQAALEARNRRFQLVILKQGLHPTRANPILASAEEQNVPVKFVSVSEIDAMAKGKTHGGVLALAESKPPLTADDFVESIPFYGDSPFLLLLEGVDDSQNLGFTLRTAEAMGVHAVLLKKHLWDFDEAALCRSSSGALERIPMVLFDQTVPMLPGLKKLGIHIYGSIANSKYTLYDKDLTEPILLCVGGEKRGLSAAVRDHCEAFIKIPMQSQTGSLSLSHAASILLGETMRQRFAKREKLISKEF
jgi:23S rRNA (guanosine2251-2'-O)-methyltransferase